MNRTYVDVSYRGADPARAAVALARYVAELQEAAGASHVVINAEEKPWPPGPPMPPSAGQRLTPAEAQAWRRAQEAKRVPNPPKPLDGHDTVRSNPYDSNREAGRW